MWHTQIPNICGAVRKIKRMAESWRPSGQEGSEERKNKADATLDLFIF